MKLTIVKLCIGMLVCNTCFSQDTLTRADVISAAKVMDLSFTSAEINSMYDGVRSFKTDFSAIHQLSIPNSVPMSLVQNPVLPGMKFNKQQLPINWQIPNNIQLPAHKDDLAFYSLLQLASLVKNKKITSLQLTEFFIDRLNKYADTLQCLISLTTDIAYKQAKQADKEIAAGKYRGPLHGIPYGLKDLFSVTGTLTTWGAEPYKNQTINEDAFVYKQLEKAGAVLIAKVTLGALAMDDYWFGGRTKNPWNLNEGSSGSSAGSASATVAGLLPFAIGTETWGSIISPSTVCGATGLRPTFGSVSRSGAMALSWSLDKIGPICRSAEDAAVVYNYIHGKNEEDASSVNMPFNYSGKIDWSKIKIGYAKNYYTKLDSSRNDWQVLDVYKKLGAQLIAVTFPDSTVYTADIMGIIISAESAAAFDEFTRNGIDDSMTRQTRQDWPNLFRTSRFVPAVEYVNANRQRYRLMQAVNKMFETVDVVICPTWGGHQSAITNLTGHPAICFPNGFSQATPTSISLIGKLYSEATMCAVAKAYQDVTKFNKMHPPLFAGKTK